MLKWLTGFACAALLMAGGVLLHRRLLRLARETGRKFHVLLASSLSRHGRWPLGAAAVLALFSLGMAFAAPGRELAGVADTVVRLAWFGLLGWALTNATRVLADLVQWRYDIGQSDNLRARQVQTQYRVLQRVLVVLIWIAVLAGGLMQFETLRTLGGTVLASAGVAGIVIGLSAQKTFGAMIAGLQIALSTPISLDDVVIVEGEWGRIEEIAFTYVVVRIWDLRRLIVPVTYFLEKPFQNWTRRSAEILGTVHLHVDYTADVEALRGRLREICEAHPGLWNGATCSLQVTEAGVRTMTLRAVMSSPDASRSWDLRCLVREELIGFLRRTQPEALPQQRLVLETTGRGEVAGMEEAMDGDAEPA